MMIRKGFRYRLKTDSKSENALARFAGSCRFVWNKALALQKERLEAGEYCVRYKALCEHLKVWKGDEKLQWLSEAHSQPLQQVLKDLDRAIQDAFNKISPKRFPRFKKDGRTPDEVYTDQGPAGGIGSNWITLYMGRQPVQTMGTSSHLTRILVGS